MRKEIFIAVFIGIILGSIVTYGIYTANKAIINKATGKSREGTQIPTPTPTPTTNIILEITDPQPDIVTNESKIVIKGRSIENAIITITTDIEDFLVEADTQGLFSQEIALIKGANTINITASDGNKLSQTEVINLVYSTQLEMSNTSEEAQN